MDGIPVKISERYKPPKKIILPTSVQNKLNSKITFDEYDFTLERTVAEQVARLKELRQQKKLEREKNLRGQQLDVSPNKPVDHPTPSPHQQPLDNEQTTVSHHAGLNLPMNQHNSMLMPVPIATGSNDGSSTRWRKDGGNIPQAGGGNINISDFESDTSSPFDNMELKTINDLEELAHVLATTLDTNNTPSYPPPNNSNLIWSNTDHNGAGGYYNHPIGGGNWMMRSGMEPSPPPVPAVAASCSNACIVEPHLPPAPTMGLDDPSSTSSSSMGILETLQSTLRERRAKSQLPIPNNNLPMNAERDREVLDSCGGSAALSGDEEAVASARSIAEMGFPIRRVMRATRLFGNDQAKVIEFVLQLQKLEEGTAGWKGDVDEERAEKALLATDYNIDKATAYLVSLRQLVYDFGFPEQKAIQALAKFNNDRDRALDYLIS